MNPVDKRILKSLRRGPLYRPMLEVVLDISERQSREAIRRLSEKGLVEVARDVGPSSYRLTDAGVEAVS